LIIAYSGVSGSEVPVNGVGRDWFLPYNKYIISAKGYVAGEKRNPDRSTELTVILSGIIV
jgi:hypothetical protein